MNRLLLALLSVIFPLAAAAKNPEVVIDTSLGKIVVELDMEHAPVSVANFLSYVDEKAYDGTIFHRVIKDFMIQGGGHRPDMTELEATHGTIHNEADNGLKNASGTIAMARMDEIDSAGRQFYINVHDNTHLDHSAMSCTREQLAAIEQAREKGLYKPKTCKGFGYAVFGRVVDGMSVVKAIESVPTHDFKGYGDVPETPVVIKSIQRVKQ
ncbi:MAG: peptidylprolyl isomerase [Pseudomonadales bacterium]|nr:peptidylprolyl isomerase [Pseudomonadales bacterium]